MNQSTIDELAHRAAVLRETASELTKMADECFGLRGGILRARDLVRKNATTAKRRENVARKQREEEQRGSDAKAKAFGY